jgi:hypothetical protein
MGLINLRTNLKSLRFGNDTQGGGASGLPYIQTGLPEDSPGGVTLANYARNSLDYPLRGGEQYWAIAATIDTARISRFLTTFPQGTTFTDKQVRLQKSNPKIETGGLASRLNTQTYNLNANLLAQVYEQGSGIHIPRAGANANELGPDNPQAKYAYIVSHKDTNQNRLVTLYNSKISSDTTGLSLDSTITKLGISTDENLLFDYIGGPDSKYGDGNTTIFRTTNTNNSFEDYTKQTFLHSKYSPNFEQSSPTIGINYNRTRGASEIAIIAGIPGLSKTNNFKLNKPANTFAPSIGFSPTTPSFGSTPPTTFGTLPAAPPTPQFDKINNRESLDFETNAFGTISPKNIPQQGYGPTAGDYLRPEQTPTIFENTINQFGNTMGYSKLLASKNSDDIGVFPKTQDFRAQTNASALASTVSYNTGGPNGTGFKIESRIGVGNPGIRPNNLRNSFYDPFPDGQDQINMSPIYRRNIKFAIEDDSPAVRDLIKFCIEVIDNDSPKKTDRMHFRAYITNFSDNIGAEWNAQKYMGRGENFYTYQGFTRDVGFTFIVAAQSVQEMEKIYQKVNYLASTLHPDYQDGTGFMRGSLHKLTIGEYFYRTTGVITTMNITVDDNYPWEIKMRQPELRKENNGDVNASGDQLQMEVPQILKIQMNFKPIMDKLPQKGLKEPIIVSEAIANNYLSRGDFKLAEKEKPATKAPAPSSTSPTPIPPGVNTDTTTPSVTTTTNDVNTAPAVTTTTTQAAPADSWVPGSVYVSNSVTGPSGTARWEVRRAAQQGFFYWDVTSPDGSVSSGSPSSLVNNVINDAQIEATEAAGL